MLVKLAIVDDKVIVRRAIKDKLCLSGDLELVAEASDGEEFLEVWAEYKP